MIHKLIIKKQNRSMLKSLLIYIVATCIFSTYGIVSLYAETPIKASKGDLIVNIKGLADTKGFVLIDLFQTSDGFPDKRDKAVFSNNYKIPENKELTIVLSNLDFSSYTLSMVHDKNSNKKLDKNIFGIPKEGWSASNYKKAPFGVPKFEKAKFEFNKDKQVIDLYVFY